MPDNHQQAGACNRVQILPRIVAILAEVLRGFSKSIYMNSEVVY
jgi:hypothetical protein